MEDLNPAPLITASTVLAKTGAYGLVWLDTDLAVSAKYGPLVDDIQISEPITEAVPALFGYENDIKDLTQTPGQLFVLPSISMPTRELDRNGKRAPRLNITAFWSQPDNQFLILVARASSASQADIDISQQMRMRLMAEEALAQKSKELEIANRDLEEFAEIISHDLSAPLRAIRYLTEDIETALESGDHTSAKNALTDLHTQSKRMSKMMIALLDYASLGRKTEFLDTFDSKMLIEEIVRSLPRPEGITVAIEGNWPTIETMKAPLDLVIRNLIDNALKHHDKNTGTVTIAQLDLDDPAHLIFTVSDDGPGIDPRHHAAVLIPFRTLEANPSENSRGMGLALVKRTVETAGGLLTLKSDPTIRPGTQFTIKWPIKTDFPQS